MVLVKSCERCFYRYSVFGGMVEIEFADDERVRLCFGMLHVRLGWMRHDDESTELTSSLASQNAIEDCESQEPFALQAVFCQVLRSYPEGNVGRRPFLWNVVTGI